MHNAAVRCAIRREGTDEPKRSAHHSPHVFVAAWAMVLSGSPTCSSPSTRKGITALLAPLDWRYAGRHLALSGRRQPPAGVQRHGGAGWFPVFANVIILGSGLWGVALAYDYSGTE